MEVDLYSMFTLISLHSCAAQDTETRFSGLCELCRLNMQDKGQSGHLCPLLHAVIV